MDPTQALFQKIDCLRLYVPDLERGINYYHRGLGLPIAWKTEHEIGLLLGDGVGELVIQDLDQREETDLKVKSVLEAVRTIERAGGRVAAGPFDIKIGRCAVVEDPWHNRLVILDSTKGEFVTAGEGNIVGHKMGDAPVDGA